MTDWPKVLEADYALPADRDVAELVGELTELLRSPDPALRDQLAYSVLATWIGRGVVEGGHLIALGDELAARFDDPAIQARTFAPLILDSIVSRGAFAAGWLVAFDRWYRRETDLRGFDPKLGWLHAVAHGADLLGAFGQSPDVSADELVGLLDLAAARLLARTDYVFAAWEDDRVASAIAAVLARPELAAAQALGWLTTIADDVIAAGWPAPVPAWSSNTLRTLRMLYLLLDRGFRLSGVDELVAVPHRDALLARLAEVLRLVTPQLG